MNRHTGNSHHHNELEGKNLGIAIFLNVLITVAQIIGSIISGSLSLLSDAMHNFSDVVALIISWFANKLSRKNVSQFKTFGYKRAEIVAAIINSVSLIVIAIYIFKEAIERMQSPEMVNSVIVMILGGISIVLNGLSVWLIHKDSKENMNIKAAYLHLLADMVTSVAVVLGGLCIYLWKVYWVDSVLSVIIAAYLMVVSWKLVVRGLRIIMQFAPADTDVLLISKELKKIEGVKNIHHVHLWQLNDKQIYFEGHVEISEDIKLSEVNHILHEIETKLVSEFKISHVILQPEYKRHSNEDLIVDE